MAGFARTVEARGIVEGGLLPTSRQELLQQVIVHAGAHVKGAVYGAQVELRGPCVVERAVFSSGDVRVDAKGTVDLLSSLGARENIVSEGRGGFLRVHGDVLAKRVHLKNAFVKGAISAAEVRLSGCVVFGPVVGESIVEVEESMILMATGQQVELGNAVKLLLPMATAERRLSTTGDVAIASLDPQRVALSVTDARQSAVGGQTQLSAGWRGSDLGVFTNRAVAVFRRMLMTSIPKGLRESNANMGDNDALPNEFLGAMLQDQ